MVKTTILLDDEIYRRLVKESIERYGTTKKLSKVINERLRQSHRGGSSSKKKRLTMKLGRTISEKELEEKIEAAWGETAKWSA